jgi:hypothetical protein
LASKLHTTADSFCIEGVRLKLSEIRTSGSVLGAVYGPSWPLVLIRCQREAGRIFRASRWSRQPGPEAQFVQRLTLAAAIYQKLLQKFEKDEAFDIVKRIIVPIGTKEQFEHASKMTNDWKDEMARLEAFHDLMDVKGGPRFNTRIFLERTSRICHFQITRCVFFDFFSEIGLPELTKLFCEVDRVFFPAEFPKIKFHRNGSWENTIAYGKDHCEFVFESI